MKSSQPTCPHILLVDDGQIILSGLTHALKDAGMHLETTTSPHHAMRLVEERRFDAIVSDQDMPELSGLELLAWVRANHPGVLRYVLAGKRSLLVAGEAMSAGVVQRFFSKPCNAFDLITTIRQALEHRALIENAVELTRRAHMQSHFLQELERLQPGIAERADYARRDDVTWFAESTKELLAAMRDLLDRPLFGVQEVVSEIEPQQQAS